MLLRTEIDNPADFLPSFSHRNSFLSLGSCFAENISLKLQEMKFEILNMPFKTVFNPLSIGKNLMGSLQFESKPEEEKFVQWQNFYFHYDYHSTFHHQQKEVLSEKISLKHQEVRSFLARKPILLITLGTAWVYALKNQEKQNAWVANCHKQPSQQFEKVLLNIEEIVKSITECYQTLIPLYAPDKPIIILSVSPVRHTRDTLVLNNISKSILRVACHQLASTFETIYYFPAYEILLDDLRDYRFYEPDLIHPNTMAIDYIWDYFLQHYFSTDTQHLLEKWSKVRKSLAHRPLLPDSQGYINFLAHLEKEIQSFATFFSVEEELYLCEALKANLGK
ncbi:MAG: hypothetical protein EAZ55_09400 [Cytophagales bacterium]|nr:MAG: hypothetical protein EAZ55_09400 [Cytophagales bacterium]